MFARKFSLICILMLTAYSIVVTVLYLKVYEEKRSRQPVTTDQREPVSNDIETMQEKKLRQSYINLLETLSSPGEKRRVHFFRSLFAYNLLSLGEEWRCNPPPQILGAVVNGVQGSTITLKTRVNQSREVFIFAVVE